MRVTLIDCYDSFTYNIVQALGVLGLRVTVLRCDDASIEKILDTEPEGLVVGPGPGHPKDSGTIIHVIQKMHTKLPILGICLGHQAIGLAFGAALMETRPVHGHAAPIHHSSQGLFAGLNTPVPMTRYHSLVIDPESLPEILSVTAHSPDGVIMAIQHRSLPIFGVQFHPESVLSGKSGLRIIDNFKAEIAAFSRQNGALFERYDRVFA